jgi:hypothetical protein
MVDNGVMMLIDSRRILFFTIDKYSGQQFKTAYFGDGYIIKH